MQPIAIGGQTEVMKENGSHEGIIKRITTTIGHQDTIMNTTKDENNITLDESFRMVRLKNNCRIKNGYTGFPRARLRANM